MAKGIDIEVDDHDEEEAEQSAASAGVAAQLPTGYLSVSQLNLYFSCARRYWYRYVQKKRGRTTSYMAQGGLVHSVAEKLTQAWIDSKFTKLPTHEMMNDLVSTEIAEVVRKIAVWEKVHAVDSPAPMFEEETRTLAAVYLDDRLPTLRPRKVEMKITGLVNDVVPMVGYIDVIDRDLEQEKAFGIPESTEVQPTDIVRDTKVTAKKYHGIKVMNSLQLSTYALLTGTRKVGYDLVVRAGKRVPARLFSCPEDTGGVAIRTEGELKWAADVIQDTARSIIAGNFPRCDPESWACNPSYCDHFAECRGTYGPLTFFDKK